MQEVPGDWEQQDTVSLQQSLPRGNSSQTGGVQLPKKCFPFKREGVQWLSFQAERTNKKATAEVMESSSVEVFRSVWMWVRGGLGSAGGNGWT